MRRILRTVMPVLLLLGLARAGAPPAEPAPGASPAVLWSQSFEDRLPGECPSGWKQYWGVMPPSDTFAVSNLVALAGDRSLLASRDGSAGERVSQYGFACLTAPVPAAGGRLTVPFLLQGAGNEAGLGLEIRDHHGNKKIVWFYGGNGSITVHGGARGQRLGPMRPGEWQRLIVVFAADGQKATAALERRLPAGTWQAEGTPCELVLRQPLGKDRRLCPMLCFGPSGRPCQLYLDQLTLEP